MLHHSDEERLSAYFDGELSPAEDADVERLLRENPTARAWLEQVEDLHTELRSLPAFRLERDFADEVMRRAERTMLLGDSPEPRRPIHATPAHQQSNGAASNGATNSNGTMPNHREIVANNRAAAPLLANLASLDHQGKIAEAGREKIIPASAAEITAAEMMPRATATPTIVRPAVVAGQRWQAPTWLAAAASLLLFAGVLSLGMSERNWANTASSGNRGAAGLQAFRSERSGRNMVDSPSPLDEASVTEFLGNYHEKESGATTRLTVDDAKAKSELRQRTKLRESPPRTEPNDAEPNYAEPNYAEPNHVEPAAGGRVAANHSKGDTRESAETAGSDGLDLGVKNPKVAELNRSAVPASSGGGLGDRVAPAAGAMGGLATPAAPGRESLGRLPRGLANNGAPSTSPANSPGATENETVFSYFSANLGAAKGPTNVLPVSAMLAGVVVVDVDGAPAEAIERIEQALGRDPGVTDAYRDSNRGRQSATTMRRLMLQEQVGRETSEKKDAAQAKDELAKRPNLGETSATRVYVIDVPPEELARVLREVATTEKAHVAVTRLDNSLPPVSPERMPDLQADGDQKLGPPASNLAQSRLGAIDADDQIQGKTAGIPLKITDEKSGKSASGGTKPVRASTTVAPAAAPPPTLPAVTADLQKPPLKSADKNNESSKERGGGGEAPRVGAAQPSGDPALHNAKAKPVSPGEEMRKGLAGQAGALTKAPRERPSPPNADADVQRLHDTEKHDTEKHDADKAEKLATQQANIQPTVRYSGTASGPAGATPRWTPTIIVLRVNSANQPAASQPAKTSGAR